MAAADRDVINRMSEITNALNQKGSVAFTFMQVFLHPGASKGCLP